MTTGFSEGNDRRGFLRSPVDEPCREIYDKQCRRIYSLAFWMTNSRRAAQRLASRTFLRAFTFRGRLGTERIDQAFLREVRDSIPMASPHPDEAPNAARASQQKPIHNLIKGIDLEAAVVQLPAAERLIFLLHDVEAYDQRRICRLLHFRKDQVLIGLLRARMRIRELVARMQKTAERASLPTCIY